MVLSRNHEQHGQFYYVCMIWYLDEAKLWQLSVGKHISSTVIRLLSHNSDPRVWHIQHIAVKTYLIILDRNASLKWKSHLSWIDKSHVWDCEQR